MGVKRSGVWGLCLVLLSLTSMATALLPSLAPLTAMKIQGSIFCLKSGNQAAPMPGAKARIECKTLGGAPYTIISSMANDHGFYTATASGVKLVGCKAFLHSSSQWECRVSTDMNGGRKGAPLIAFSPLSQSFSVKPFFYAPR